MRISTPCTYQLAWFAVALGDFGTGYSSMQYLNQSRRPLITWITVEISGKHAVVAAREAATACHFPFGSAALRGFTARQTGVDVFDDRR